MKWEGRGSVTRDFRVIETTKGQVVLEDEDGKRTTFRKGETIRLTSEFNYDYTHTNDSGKKC